jgi:REP element-mobilizing transposase RayT
MAHTQILYQLVFSTKNREAVLTEKNRDQLFAYIAGILMTKKCFCYQVGGVEDHVHMVFSLHPTVALSELVMHIKVSSNKYIKENNLFPKFSSWVVKYGAFTYDLGAKDNLIAYVKNQKEHHKRTSFIEEYLLFLKEFNVDYDEKYVFE